MCIRDRIAIGNRLTNRDRILITRSPLVSKSHSQPLKTKVFDYCISFTDDPGETGWFGPEARSGNLRRCWDITMPEAMDQLLWNGCARRHINGYVPFFESENSWISDKYPRLENNADFKPHPGEPKLLDHLACEDRRLNEKQRWVGVEAVSYTHLDVYKRQALPSPRAAAPGTVRGRWHLLRRDRGRGTSLPL